MELFDSSANIPIQSVIIPGIVEGPSFFMKRLDLIDPVFGGNKAFKLKYHIEKVLREDIKVIVSYGGPFSNHLYALAGIGKKLNIKTVGIVRGFEHYRENPNLSFCKKAGMEIKFLGPTQFKDTNERNNLISRITAENGEAHIVPEGGTDELGVEGAAEMLSEDELIYDYYCIGVGSAGSISGLINKTKGNGTVLGFSALKGAQYLEDIILSYTKNCPKNWKLIHDYYFGGFAKQNEQTIGFHKQFEDLNNFEIDPVYQLKMLLGLEDLTKKHYFSNKDKVLVLHTGGIQAKKGYEYMAKS